MTGNCEREAEREQEQGDEADVVAEPDERLDALGGKSRRKSTASGMRT